LKRALDVDLGIFQGIAIFIYHASRDYALRRELDDEVLHLLPG
jgi:hypothetical protein